MACRLCCLSSPDGPRGLPLMDRAEKPISVSSIADDSIVSHGNSGLISPPPYSYSSLWNSMSAVQNRHQWTVASYNKTSLSTFNFAYKTARACCDTNRERRSSLSTLASTATTCSSRLTALPVCPLEDTLQPSYKIISLSQIFSI